MSEKLAIVLFSGTADKLQAAATMVSGAAAMGVETHLFLTFWGLNAFTKAQIDEPKPMSADYGHVGEQMGKLMMDKGVPAWSQIIRDAREIGDVHIHACSMTMDLQEMTQDDLDPMIDDVIGVATFIGLIEGGQTLFI